MTQEHLAESAGISQVQIARIERGNLNTSVSTLISIIKALDTTPNDLLEGC
jgi:predicted transcriptional regulator